MQIWSTKHTIEEIIKSYVNLSHQNTKQWYPVVCKVCNDHGKKGPRAGFNFGQNGDELHYHCFNCKHVSNFVPKNGDILDDNSVKTLSSFNIPSDDILPFQFVNLGVRSKKVVDNPHTNKSATVIEQPDHWKLLSDFKPGLSEVNEYLLSRHVNIENYNFFISTNPLWKNRVIIPIYNSQNQLIFYQGRLYNNKNVQHRKYLNPELSREYVIGGMPQLTTNLALPLFITEGWFDSHIIDGVCLFENVITKGQQQILNNTSRQKVIVPDKDAGGLQLALQGLSLGWSISTPDIGDCKDINGAFTKFGKLYVMKSLYDNIHSGFAGIATAKIWCGNKGKK